MIAFRAQDLRPPPLSVWGEGALRLPGNVAGAAAAPDGALWVAVAGGLAVVDPVAWTLRAMHRATSPGPSLPVCLGDGRHVVCREGDALVLRDAADGAVRARVDAPFEPASASHAGPADAPDALYVFGARSLARWRAAEGTLVCDATRALPTRREPFGYEVRAVAGDAGGGSLYVASERDVLRVDARTLADPAAVFDVDAWQGDPRGWIDGHRIRGVACGPEGLFVLVTRRHTQARLLRVSRDGAEVEALDLPPTRSFDALSARLAGGRLVVTGLGGARVVDAARLAVVATRDAPVAGATVDDPARAAVYALGREGAVDVLRVDGGLHVTSHPGWVPRWAIRWSAAGVVALSPEAGVERFATPRAAPERVAGSAGWRSAGLSPGGAWLWRDGGEHLVAIPLDAPDRRRAIAEAPPSPHAEVVAVTDAGAVWWWTGRGLQGEGGARVAVAAREVHGSVAVSRCGRLALVVTPRHLTLVDLARAAVRWTLDAPGVTAAAFFDGGIVVAARAGLRWIDLDTAAVAVAHRARLDATARPAASPDGATVALLSGVGATAQVELLRRDDPARRARLVAGLGVTAAAFSPDGAALVVAGRESVLRAFSVEAAFAARDAGPRRRKRG